MTSKPYQPWIPLDKIELLVQIEPAVLILSLVLGAWISYKIFFPKLSLERHRLLKALFRNVFYYLIFGAIFFGLSYSLQRVPAQNSWIDRVEIYSGLAAVIFGAVVFVKVSRILVFQYFFLSHMKVSFPVLLVNLITLLLSVTLIGWIGSELFNIRLAPLLATSAIFSIILGLALQDTLGNLFSGVALQFDKPYEIGNWIEVQSGLQRWTGRVIDISWRATLLVGPSDEFITIPNKLMGQAQISNFSSKYNPIVRSQYFKLPFGSDVEKVKTVLTDSAKQVETIRRYPPPAVFVAEVTESWISFKLLYYIDNFGEQYKIADRILTTAVSALQKAGYNVAGHRLAMNESSSETSQS